jgi:hypothetical protein
VILDGTLVPIDLIAADRPFYSGKHRQVQSKILRLRFPPTSPSVSEGST